MRGSSPRELAQTTTGEMAMDPVSHDEIDAILAGQHHNPHAVLGAHPLPGGAAPSSEHYDRSPGRSP